MGCVSWLRKHLPTIYNIIMFISSGVLLAGGILYLLKSIGLVSSLYYLGGLAIGVGGVTLIIALLSCCGWCGFLFSCSSIIFICLLAGKIVLAVLTFVKIHDSGSFNHEITDVLQDLFHDTSDCEDFYNIQKDMQCCGVLGNTDYNTTQSYPITCCYKLADPCYQPYKTGCASKLFDVLQLYLIIISAVAAGFAVIEAVCGACLIFFPPPATSSSA